MTPTTAVYVLNSPVVDRVWGLAIRRDRSMVERARCAGRRLHVCDWSRWARRSSSAALLGVDVPVNRIAVVMQPGDRALVLRLQARLAEARNPIPRGNDCPAVRPGTAHAPGLNSLPRCGSQCVQHSIRRR